MKIRCPWCPGLPYDVCAAEYARIIWNAVTSPETVFNGNTVKTLEVKVIEFHRIYTEFDVLGRPVRAV